MCCSTLLCFPGKSNPLPSASSSSTNESLIGISRVPAGVFGRQRPPRSRQSGQSVHGFSWMKNGLRVGIYVRIPEVGDLLQTAACRAIQPDKQVELALSSPLHRNDFLVGVRFRRICRVFESITPFHLNRRLDPVSKECQDE